MLDKIKSIVKSRTFWGGLAFTLIKYLESQDLIPADVTNLAEAAAVGFGLYGARNAKVK